MSVNDMERLKRKVNDLDRHLELIDNLLDVRFEKLHARLDDQLELLDSKFERIQKKLDYILERVNKN